METLPALLDLCDGELGCFTSQNASNAELNSFLYCLLARDVKTNTRSQVAGDLRRLNTAAPL